MTIETAVLAIYALRGRSDLTIADRNVGLDIECLRYDAAADGYAFTSETEADFVASGWTVAKRYADAVKMTKGKADIYMTAINDAALGVFGSKNLTFLDA